MAGDATRTLLLVDDEPAQGRLVAAMAGRAGWRTLTVPDGGRATALIAGASERVDAVLIDVWRPAESGAMLVREMRARWPELPIVMLTAQASVGLAVEAMRAGASDFLLKPLAPERLLAALAAAAAPGTARGELRPLAEKVTAPLDFDGIVGSAPTMRAALAAAAMAARTRAPVLVTGAAGTGKTLVAGAIHAASGRGRHQPVVVHCGAMPPAQIAWDLFGYAEGAVPGAFRANPGQVARADGGTLILAEVTKLGADAQAQLVALLRDGQITPPGTRAPVAVDVRVIGLSERPLAEAVTARRFRCDLAEALAAHEVALPPLAERPSDVPALARHLIARIGRQPAMRRLELSGEAAALLAAHDWPGNVRQLHDTLFRAALAADGDVLGAADFPGVARAASGIPGRSIAAAGVEIYAADGHLRPLDALEADIIRLAIGHYRGRMSEVARRLGIGRSTLYRKLVELGLDTAA